MRRLLNKEGFVHVFKIDGTQIPLYYGEIKVTKDKYHAIPELDLVNNWILTEVWIDSTAIPPYVLMLLGDDQDNFAIYDPKDNYHLIYACSSYEEAKLWLLEDEYEKVEGRISIEKVS